MATKATTTKKKTNGNGDHDPNAKAITVTNAGPIKEFTLAMKEGPGLYRLRGENGTGKSHFQRAWLKATGHGVDVGLRDGAKELTVDFNGENLLSLKKVKATGDVEGEIWSDCPLADFILPDASDPNVNERRRIEALLRLIDQDVTNATIRTLLGGLSGYEEDSEEYAEMIEECVDNAFDYVMEQEGDTIHDQNIVVAKERVRRRVHEIKRRMEQAGETAQAEINVHTKPRPEVVVDIPAAKAVEVYETRVGDLREKQGSARERVARETEREEIRQTLGTQPDVEDAERDQAEAEELLANSVARKSKIESQINELRTRLAVEETQYEDCKRATVRDAGEVAARKAAFASWERRKAILDSEITGATPGELELATKAVEQARVTVEQARASEAWKESCRLTREAAETREKVLARAKIYEAIAVSTTGQLAVLLAQAGVTGLTVENDQLCEIQPGGELEPVSRLSEGERARIGLQILLKNQTNPHNVLVLPGRLVRSLGPKAYAEVETELIRAGQFAIYEQPAEGELSSEKAVGEMVNA